MPSFFASQNNNATKRTRLYEKKGKYIPLYPTTIWSDNEEPSNDEWANVIGTERPQGFTPEQGKWFQSCINLVNTTRKKKRL